MTGLWPVISCERAGRPWCLSGADIVTDNKSLPSRLTDEVVSAPILLFMHECFLRVLTQVTQGLPARSSVKTTQGLPARSVLKMIHWIIFRAYLTHWTVFRDAAHPSGCLRHPPSKSADLGIPRRKEQDSRFISSFIPLFSIHYSFRSFALDPKSLCLSASTLRTLSSMRLSVISPFSTARTTPSKAS